MTEYTKTEAERQKMQSRAVGLTRARERLLKAASQATDASRMRIIAAEMETTEAEIEAVKADLFDSRDPALIADLAMTNTVLRFDVAELTARVQRLEQRLGKAA